MQPKKASIYPGRPSSCSIPKGSTTVNRNKLFGTLFSEHTFSECNECIPCIIYLHSHSGCQTEAEDIIRLALNEGFSLCCFDFSGYGRSEGDFSTLGLKETYDVQAVVNHLTNEHKFKYYFIWGRSMGASTAIRYSVELSDNKLFGIILDSPFSDVKTMVIDTMSESGIPRLFTSICLLPIAATLKDKTGYDVLNNSPGEMSSLIKTPTLVIVGNHDTITRPDRVKAIYDSIDCNFD